MKEKKHLYFSDGLAISIFYEARSYLW